MVDKFHDENQYAIGLCDRQVVAMIAIRANRPFSLDQKLDDLDKYLPEKASICEFRLWYLVPEHRNGKLMRGLMETVRDYCMAQGYDFAVISGTTRQEKLYRHLGFEPFGPLVGAEGAWFQPMYLTLNAVKRQIPWMPGLEPKNSSAATASDSMNGSGGEHKASTVGASNELSAQPVNFLPGPVNVPAEVYRALASMPVSHRSDRFLADVRATKEMLCRLAGAQHCEFLFGSGTLANEAVAAQLSRRKQRGIVLNNGEFGSRLVQQAKRWQLDFVELSEEWGTSFDYDLVQARVANDPSIGWMWTVHCETSTGMLNDVARLAQLCAAHNVRLCVDCVSSIGAVPMRLQGVHLATGTSGKALAALPGIAIVFCDEPIAPDPSLPSYLDLGKYGASDGVPFTISSNLLYALHAAVKRFDNNSYTATAADAARIREGIRALGLQIVCTDEQASPAVTTIVLPATVDSVQVGDQLENQGFLVSYMSHYLVKRNWIQICLMGEYPANEFERFLQVLASLTVAQHTDGVGARGSRSS